MVLVKVKLNTQALLNTGGKHGFLQLNKPLLHHPERQRRVQFSAEPALFSVITIGQMAT